MTQEEIIIEISTCKQLLNQTDYKCLKFAEGALSAEDFAETQGKRAAWRARINELEELLEGAE